MTPEQTATAIATARAWVRTPYRHRGNRLGVGCDCLMLILAAYVAAGIVAPDFEVPDYPADLMFHSDDARYVDGVLSVCDEVTAPMPGDLALWFFGKTFSHGAVVVSWPRIIHAYAPFRAVVEMNVQDDLRLARRPVRFFSPKEPL